MTHVDEGILLAIRDGELVSADHSLHVDSCAHCRGAMDEARRRSAEIERALASVSSPVDVEAAKAAVRARMDAGGTVARPRTRWSSGGHLGRAAAVLVVAAGAVYALPGSPVRGWFASDTPPVERATVPALPVPVADGSMIEVAVAEEVSITLSGVPAGTLIEVVWLDEPVGRVYAPPGSTYSFATGRIAATVTSGPTRIEVPRGAATVSIVVNGRTVLRGSATDADIVGAVEQDQDHVVLAAPGSRD